MRIVVLCEGKTEQAIKSGLRQLIQEGAAIGRRIGLDTICLDGHIEQGKFQRLVARHIAQQETVGVVALTDVYPNYQNADQAIDALRNKAGTDHVGKFRVHVAKFELEAWLIPHWDDIAKWLDVERKPPGPNPESEIADLRAIVEGTASGTGELFFQSLVQHFASIRTASVSDRP